MTLQTVSFNDLQPPKSNPRSTIDQKTLKGLADSIRTDGILQNLVVILTKNKRKPYRIISGERRFRALQLLKKKGQISNDFQVPVEIRDGLTDDEAIRIATVENMQREALPPLDEAKALKKLVHDGVCLDDIAAQTGLSPRIITRRLALNNLCSEAQTTLSEGKLSLSQAEALTIGNEEAQQRILEQVINHDESPETIKNMITMGKPSKAEAIFPLEQYSGNFTRELFADDETTYFDDVEQFMLLQEAAVNVLAASHRNEADFVEISHDYSLKSWLYDEAPEGETGGIVINLSPSGEVEVKTGLLKTKAEEETLEVLKDRSALPDKPKASYAKSACTYMACHKTMAVQTLLLGDTRKAKEVAVMQLMGSRDHEPDIIYRPHKAPGYFREMLDKPPAYNVLEKEAQDLVALVGQKHFDPLPDGQPNWKLLLNHSCRADEKTFYEAVNKLSDDDLERLLLLLLIMPFGQRYCDELDTEDSLFNAVACDMGADMSKNWIPDRAFLEKRNTAQLQKIALECGYADGRSLLGSYKKGELVTGLERFFKEAHAAADPSKSQWKAITWLPEAMNFPAINPDVTDETECSLDEAA